MTFDFCAVRLARGAHKAGSRELCLMEAVAHISGEKHSDNPPCVDPTLATAGRSVNDWMTQEERDELLAPMLFDFAGTRGTAEHERARGYIAVDYAVRVFAPIALRATGLEADAVRLESLPKVVDRNTAMNAEIAARAASARAASASAAYARAASASAASASAASARAASASAASACAASACAASARAASACAASARAASASDVRRKIVEALCQMLRDMIAVHHSAPREWARSPETLPCLIGGAA